MMNIPLGDFNRGPLVAPSFAWKGERVAPTSATKTCSARNSPHASATRRRAPTILANLSNIGWFGETMRSTQHLQISRMRTLELQRPMLRATNTGATVVIDHRGRVHACACAAHPRRARGQVQGREGLTPFARWAARLRAVAAGSAGAGIVAAFVATPLAAHARGDRLRPPRGRPLKSRLSFRAAADAHLPANHPSTARLLGRPGLRTAAALRHGSRRRHQPHRDLPARARPRALEGRLCAAEPPPQGRPLRQEPEPPAALLPVPGGAQARAGQHPRALPRLARSAGLRPKANDIRFVEDDWENPTLGCLGPGLGGLAQRHGGDAVHLLPAGRRHRLQADHRRDHLRPRAPGDVPAGRGQRLRPDLDSGPAAS